jgi:hypothetical protein
MVGFSFVHYLGVDPEEIGVIASSKAQLRAIRELLKVAKMSDISVGSVEQFQGQVWTSYESMVDSADIWTRNGKSSFWPPPEATRRITRGVD